MNKNEQRAFNLYQKKLEPLATIYCQMIGRIEFYSTKKLNYILKNKDKLTETNCWWATYGVIQIIEPIIKSELLERKKGKKPNKNPI